MHSKAHISHVHRQIKIHTHTLGLFACAYRTRDTHTWICTLSSSSNTDGYTPPLLEALNLQWPVRLQLLMPCGACFTALPQGPNRLSISRWAAALFPINKLSTGRLQAPWGPSLEGGESRRNGSEGSWQERLRWNCAMLLGQRAVWRGWTCHFLSFYTHTDTHNKTRIKAQFVCK